MTDTQKTLICPACGKEMEKVFIPSQGINIDICTKGCGGIFFDNKEFDNFDEKDEDISSIVEKIDGKTFKKPSQSMTRVCPNCGAKMVKNHSSIHKTIEIDECYTCGGKFLDNGELVKIREEYDNNKQRDEDILRYLYKEVGQELAAQEQAYSEIVPHRTYIRKLFYKLTGM
jgi:Zn-finger nucleic acid-binding protein